MSRSRSRTSNSISVEISPGELIDRLSILRIKTECVSDPDKLRNVLYAFECLLEARERELESSEALTRLEAELKSVNEALWEIEDEIRTHEAAKDFGDRFIELARSVYRTNDRRAAIKKEIDHLFGSAITDEKSYAEY